MDDDLPDLPVEGKIEVQGSWFDRTLAHTFNI